MQRIIEMPSSTLLCLALFLALTIVVRCVFGARRLPGIPYHPIFWWLPLGSLLELGVHFVRTGETFDWLFYQAARYNSPIAQVFMPNFSLTKPIIVISDLREAEHIVTKRSHDIDRSSLMHDFFKLLAPNSTIGMKSRGEDDATTAAPPPHAFKKQRKLWSCMTTPRMIKKVAAPAMYRVVQQMITLWGLKAENAPDCAFHVDLDLRQTALEGMWITLTSNKLGICDHAQDSVKFATEGSVSINRKKRVAVFYHNTASQPKLFRALSSIFTCIDWVTTGFSSDFYTWLFQHTGLFTSAIKVKNEFLADAIDAAKNRVSRRSSQDQSTCTAVLDEVILRSLESEEDEATNPISNEALIDETLELLITGHETTASATGWALKYLADNQDVQQQLWQSLVAKFPNAAPNGPLPSTEELLETDLPYLDAVISETLRLSRTGPVSFRETVRDCHVLGHRLEAGTHLIVMTENFDLSQHYPYQIAGSKMENTAWSPSTFAPQRWIDINGQFNPKAYPSMPFSAGPRGCFGRKIALLELRFFLALIVLSFRLPKLAPGLSKYSSRDGLTRRPTHCYVKPEKRGKPQASTTARMV